MKCIILINQKGGVAKTTSTYNLAAAKASQGKTVLMIDLDPQASLTIMCGSEPGEERFDGHGTCDLFQPKADPFDAVFRVSASGLDNIYLVPADIDLAETERDLILRMHSEVRLKKAIEKLAGEFDYIFVDCPPQLGQLTVNALVAADEVIIPCKTDYISYRGLRALLDTVEQVREEELNESIHLAGIIGTFYEERVNDQRAALEMMAKKAPIIGTVRKSADVPRHTLEGLPVVLAMPECRCAEEYRRIADLI